MEETRTYKNGKLVLEESLDLSNIPDLSIYIKIFNLLIVIGVLLGISFIVALILLGVLDVSNMRVISATIFLTLGFIIFVVGIIILINPFVKYSRIVHGTGSILSPLSTIRLRKIKNLYLSYPNQDKLNNLLEKVKTKKFRLRILMCTIGLIIFFISAILYVVFITM